MCSLFEMENYQGDLTDIVRGSGGGTYGCKTGGMPEDLLASDWQFPSEAAVNFSSSVMEEPREYSFGDPFCAAMRDPLLHELDMSGSSASTFFNGGTGGLEDNVSGGSCSFTASATVLSPTIGSHEDELKRPCNIFSRMLQISPARNKFPISPCDSPLLGNSPRALINTNSDLHHFVDNTGGVQISSPRNPAGIKRRKSQARKVVCVPAPVAASCRPNGEVIPSDLWAWRKYGQKPIKGSPYPRGYYRCSSSKGCSARKQVERSRTDPNMLVITYTSEHNHPWPTQRNALAGSSRSQQSKSNTANSKLSAGAQPQKPIPEGEKKEICYEDNSARGSAPSASTVKEELVEDMDKQFEADDGDFSEGFPYRLTMPSNNQSDDFFADLEELETDPLNLLFAQGAAAGGGGDGGKGSKGLDVPFNLFDWAAENNANSTPFQEAGGKRGFY